MRRKSFIFSILTLYPAIVLGKIKNLLSMNHNDEGFKVAAGESRFKEHLKIKFLLPPSKSEIQNQIFDAKISEKDTDGNLSIFETTGFAKGGPPLHKHPDQDEVVEVMEGEFDVRVGNETYRLVRGDIVFMPRNVAHTWRQKTEKGRVKFTFQPAGKMEDFFAKAALWSSHPPQEELVQFFKDHGMIILGPPLKED
jgi:quercetin dioxygenase-like cupin family protein